MDLIMCRNVLIYFGPETIAAVAQRLFKTLAPGGWLITGPSDPALGELAPFEVAMSDFGIAYRRPTVVKTFQASASPLAGVHPAADEKLGVTDQQENQSQAADAFPAVADSLQALNEHPGVFAPVPGRLDTGIQEVAREVGTLSQARQAFSLGDYERAAALAAQLPDSQDAALIRVRSSANQHGPKAAETEVVALLQAQPFSHILHAALLLDLGKLEAAADAARRAVYLDRSLAAAHFVWASSLYRQGHAERARLAFQNAHSLCATRPADELVAFMENERAGALAEAAAQFVATIDKQAGHA
jgi:chemotaxis protein methyltransferase CheR